MQAMRNVLKTLSTPILACFIASHSGCGDGATTATDTRETDSLSDLGTDDAADVDDTTERADTATQADGDDTATPADGDAAGPQDAADSGVLGDTTPPSDTTSTDSTPADTIPDSTPADTTPDSTPADTIPDSTPADTIPDSTPADTTSTDTAPGDTSSPDTSTPTTGESCLDPRTIGIPTPFSAPITVLGDTTDLTDDHAVSAYTCPGLYWDEGAGAPDEVWSFRAPTDGIYRFSLQGASEDLGFYALAECTSAPRCHGGADAFGAASTDDARIPLAAGEVVYLVVDAVADANPTARGAYKLTVDPPTPRLAGDTCREALIPTLEVGTGDYVGAGDISPRAGLTDNLTALACGGAPWASGELVGDQVWRFVVPEPGTWVMTLTPGNGSDPLTYALAAPCDSQVCLANVVDAGFGGEPETLELGTLTIGTEVFVVVDAWSPEAAGPYKVRFTRTCASTCRDGRCGEPDGCGGLCGCAAGTVCQAGACVAGLPGDRCDDPLALDTDGTLHKGRGDLSVPEATDSRALRGCVALGDTFDADGVGTPDQFWSFAVSASGPHTIRVTPEGATDPLFALFLGTDCSEGACSGYVDETGSGEVEAREFDLAAGVPYTLMVDTWDLDGAGPYTIEVVPACAPRCDPAFCGEDDGCGGLCGCGAGETCDLGLCVLQQGDTCLSPYVMREGASTFSGSGDLLGPDVTDNYGTESCPLLDGFPSSGDGTPDEVFVFDVTAPGTHTIAVENLEDADTFFTLYRGDLCESSECLGLVDNGIAGEYDKFDFLLEPGRYTLVIDTFDVDLGAGPYNVTVTRSR
jgi:hypothetical protein